MKKQSGFTLIELIIFSAIIIILLSIAWGALTGNNEAIPQDQVYQPPVAEMYQAAQPSVSCIEGFKFVSSKDAITQMRDDAGNGIRC